MCVYAAWYAFVLLFPTSWKPFRIAMFSVSRFVLYMLKYRRSLLKAWSTRKLYWRALRNGLGLNVALSDTGRLQGILPAAGVPHADPKACCAVWLTPVATVLNSGYCVSSCVPIVFGKACLANATNSG